MKFYVYYPDCYGDPDLQEFDNEREALEFISKRITEDSRTVEHYTLIHGNKIPLKAVEQVTKVARGP